MKNEKSPFEPFNYIDIVAFEGNSCCSNNLENSIVQNKLYKLVFCQCSNCHTDYDIEKINEQFNGAYPICTCGGLIVLWELKRCGMCKRTFHIPKPYNEIFTSDAKMPTIYMGFDASRPIVFPHDRHNPVLDIDESIYKPICYTTKMGNSDNDSSPFTNK